MIGTQNESPFDRYIASEYRSDPLSIFTAFEHEFSALAERFGFDWGAVRSNLPAASPGSKRKYSQPHFFQRGKNPFKGKTALWVEFKQSRSGLVYPLITANCFSTGEETISGMELVWDEYKRSGGRDFQNSAKREQRLREREQQRAELAKKQAEAAERAKLEQAIRAELHEYYRVLFERAPLEDGSHPYLIRKQITRIVGSFDLRRVAGSLREFNDRLAAKGLPMIVDKAAQRRYERQFSPCMAFKLTDVFGRYVGLQRIYPPNLKLQTVSVTDGQFKGSIAVIGDLAAERIAVVEGFATGASLYLAAQETGRDLAVVVAISADNVKDVLDQFRKVDSKAFGRMALFTDNDQWKAAEGKGNKGLLNGIDMAYKHRMPVFCPDFERIPNDQLQRWAKKHQPELVGSPASVILKAAAPTDYNDLHAIGSIQAVVEQLAEKRGSRLKATTDYLEYNLQRLSYVPHDRAEDEAYAAIKAGLGLAPFKYPSSAALLRLVLDALPIGCKIDEARLARRMHGAIKHKVRKAKDGCTFSQARLKNVRYMKMRGRMGRHGSRELSKRLAQLIGKREGIFIIRAPKGSGKTANLIGPLIKQSQFSMYVAHRIALIAGTAKRLNITDYQDVDRQNVTGVDHLAICVNSIIQDKYAPAMRDLDLLSIDEAVQTLRHVASGTVEHRVEVLDRLADLVRNSKRVVMCDADANDILLDFCQQAAPERPVYVYDMDADGSPYHVEFGELAQVFETAAEAAARGEKVLIATDSQNEGDRLKLRITELAGGKPVRLLLVHQQSREEDEAVRQFLANPNEELKKYDTVIYSPTMGTGVSIERNHFEKHFAMFYGVILPTDALQMLHRDRTAKHYVLGLGYQGGNRVATKEELLLGLIAAAQTDETGEVTVEQVPGEVTARLGTSMFDDLKLSVLAHENSARNDFANNLLLCMMADGYKVTPLDRDELVLDRGREAQKATGAAVKAERQQRVLDVETPDEDEYFRLQMKELRTRDDYAKIDRYMIERVLCAKQVTLDDVDFLEHGGLRKMAAFEDIQLERAAFAAYDRWQAGKGVAPTLRAYRTATSSIRRKVFELLGIDPATGKGEYTHVEAQNVINWLTEDGTRLHRFNYLKIGAPLNPKRPPKQPTTFVDSILERMGLKSDWRKSHGNKIRFIEDESFARMLSYFTERQQNRISSISVSDLDQPKPVSKPASVANTVPQEVKDVQTSKQEAPAMASVSVPAGDTSNVYISGSIDHPPEIEQEIEIEEFLAHHASPIDDDDHGRWERGGYRDDDDRPVVEPGDVHYGRVPSSET